MYRKDERNDKNEDKVKIIIQPKEIDGAKLVVERRKKWKWLVT